MLQIPLWVVGNGGHAKVLIDAINLQDKYRLAGTISDCPHEPPIQPGVPHIGPIKPEVAIQHGVAFAIVGIGDNHVRHRMSQLLRDVVTWVTIVHPSAIVAASSVIGEGVFLGAGTIVQPNVRIGDHVIVNTAASVDHDSTIGNYSHIAPGVRLSGNVSVGERALLGVGLSVVPGIKIGADSVVGAGSVVIHDVSEGARVAGVPARILTGRDSTGY